MSTYQWRFAAPQGPIENSGAMIFAVHNRFAAKADDVVVPAWSTFKSADPPPKKKTGLAALPVERRRAIARKGGRTAQRRGVGHKITPEERKRGLKAATRKGSSSRFTTASGRKAGIKGNVSRKGKKRPKKRKGPFDFLGVRPCRVMTRKKR